MTNLPEEKQFLIDFNVQDVAISAGIEIPDSASATILDVEEDDFVAYINEAKQTVAKVATHLLAIEASVATMVSQLNSYQRVLAIGDSITTFRYSYARLLNHLLSGVEFINHGYSGYTSNHGLELTHTRFTQLQPDLVFIKYGVNDCKLFEGADGRTLVSTDEYRGNIRGIIKAFQHYTDAKIVLLTPTPVVTQIATNIEDFKAMHMTWQNSDIKRFGDIMRELSVEHETTFVDLYGMFGDEPTASLYLADGLHPNFDGHQEILKRIASVFS
jgi:lysophospholipase L1-like esterase